jgi:polysaccharide biosynthesis transport protein
MNELTPIPPSDPGFQLMEPMASGHTPPAPKFRPQKLLRFLRKYWWIPAITLTLSVGVAIAVFFKTPPTFVSYGQLYETVKLQIPDAANYTENREDFAGTLSELLPSQRLSEMTLLEMKQSGTNRIVYDEVMNPIPVNIQVISSAKSQVYTIQAISTDPGFTPAYLNTLMQQYLDFRKTTRQGVSGVTLESIKAEALVLGQKMQTAQEELTEYEKTNNLATLLEEANLYARKLVELRTELSDFQLKFKMLAARELEVDAGVPGATDDPDLLLPSLGNNPNPSTASARIDSQKQIEMLKAERERLSQYLLPKHPKMVKLDLDITNAEALVDFYHGQNHDQIVALRRGLQIKMNDIQQFIDEYQARVSADNIIIANADGYKQEVARNQMMYERLSALVQNVNIMRGIDQETLAILHSATPAVRSLLAAKAMLTQSIIIGLGLGLGIVFLLAWRDDRFNSLVEVTEKFGDNVVGQVPELPEKSGAEPLALLADHDDRHVYAESYRNLRSALLYLAVEGRRPKIVIITSAMPNEGKSTVATNLARALALGGSRVLLVDGDLRKGRIHELLKLPARPGLSETLREPGDPGRFIQDTDLPNFSFLSRGGTTRNPGDLLLSPAVDQILARFREQYDYVLIDSSPVFAADDTSTIAPKADGVLFVVRSHFSHARMVREALELLFQRQARVLGLILNRADSSAHSYYHYKYAEYYSTANTVESDKDS